MNNQSSFHNQPKEFIDALFEALKQNDNYVVKGDEVFNAHDGQIALWVRDGDSLLIPYKDSRRKNKLWRILMRLNDVEELLGQVRVDPPVSTAVGKLYTSKDILELFKDKEFFAFDGSLGSTGIKMFGVNELGENVDLTELLNYQLDYAENHLESIKHEFDEVGFEIALENLGQIWFYEHHDQSGDFRISSHTTILTKRADGKWSVRHSI